MKKGWRKLLILSSIVVLFIVGLFWYNQYTFRKAEEKFPPTGKFVTVEGVKLHYYQQGSGKPIVFLHGGVLDGSDFKKVMERAANQGYQAIAFDRPGYGYSERPKKEKVTPMVQARLIHGALKKLGIENPILVGHSWSGILVTTYALSYPNEVAGIVMLGAAMYKEGYPAENGDPISKMATTPFIGDLLINTLLKTPLITHLAKNILKETFAPEPLPPEYEEKALALWLRPDHFKANREDVLAFSPAAEKISSKYKQIKLPVVIVVGENDPFGTKEQASRLQKELPHAKKMILPNVAHMIRQNHPQTVIHAIEQLVK